MTDTLVEIIPKFIERALLVPPYEADKEMRKNRYHDMLRSNIREFVSFSASPTFDEMISRVHKREIDLEHIRKRKAEHG